jgi:ethanolamine utilization cobalamin adenosyltransferase
LCINIDFLLACFFFFSKEKVRIKERGLQRGTMKGNESNTWLKKGTVCGKGDQSIAFRGAIDSLYAECIWACTVAKNASRETFCGLTEISKVIGNIMRCEALCESTEFSGVFGLSADQLREISQNPQKHFGLDYFWPDENASPLMAALNRFRAEVRRCEREAVRAYPESEDWQESIIACLNRLSSAAYILMLKLRLEETA